MEKVHGTSARISFNKGTLTFFTSGSSYDLMRETYDTPERRALAASVGKPFVVFGEYYGGKIQKMRNTYGDTQLFIGFEVIVGGVWLSVTEAASFVGKLDLEYVPYARIPATLEAINKERDKPSEVAVRRGIKEPRLREGVVLRPVEEMLGENPSLIVKHKGDAFKETKTRRRVTDPNKLVVLTAAKEVAEEWVTDMRISHVVDKLGLTCIEDTPKVVKAVIADVVAESEGEIVWTKEVRRAVGKLAANLWCRRVKQILD